MKKWACVDFQLCKPEECDVMNGRCKATETCTHKNLEQEEPWEPPFVISTRMCVGCSSCERGCPLGAISIMSGLT